MWVRFFFFTDTPTTEIYTLSLHDALPISAGAGGMVTDGASDGSARSMAVRRACGSAAGPVPGAGTWPGVLGVAIRSMAGSGRDRVASASAGPGSAAGVPAGVHAGEDGGHVGEAVQVAAGAAAR